MLAPLRDYLRPKDPASSPLLCTTKDHYFRRLSVDVGPSQPGFEEARWIRSEDVNVEHLLDVFTSVDPNSVSAWDACASFIRHLYWHKKRLVVLGSRIEGLPDDHRSKPRCLFELSLLFESVGNWVEPKRLLVCALKLWRERGDRIHVADTLRFLSSANLQLNLRKEGILQAKESLEIYKQLGHTPGQAQSWKYLALLLHHDNQLDAAEEAALRTINLLSDNDNQFSACECHHILGKIYCAKGETEKAIKHFETALGIASRSDWNGPLFWIYYCLAELFFGENRFDDAHAHVEHAKSHAIDDSYSLGRATELQARFWYQEHRFEDARSEALHAAAAYEGIGATENVEHCRAFLRNIEEDAKPRHFW